MDKRFPIVFQADIVQDERAPECPFNPLQADCSGQGFIQGAHNLVTGQCPKLLCLQEQQTATHQQDQPNNKEESTPADYFPDCFHLILRVSPSLKKTVRR